MLYNKCNQNMKIMKKENKIKRKRQNRMLKDKKK